MTDFNRRLKQGYSDAEWQRQHDRTCYAPQTQWLAGFFAEETGGGNRWRWCGSDGILEILNPSDHPKQIALDFVARTGQPGPAILEIKSSAFSEQLAVDAPGTTVAKTLEIPPGRLAIHFHCMAAPFVDPCRTLVFGIFNFQLQEILKEVP
jgi:hypothetical protein